jgi:hypothetical protein
MSRIMGGLCWPFNERAVGLRPGFLLNYMRSQQERGRVRTTQRANLKAKPGVASSAELGRMAERLSDFSD